MGRILVVTLRARGTSKNKGNEGIEYQNKVEVEDFKKLALLLLDLDTHGAKVEKAFLEFRKMKDEESFPW